MLLLLVTVVVLTAVVACDVASSSSAFPGREREREREKEREREREKMPLMTHTLIWVSDTRPSDAEEEPDILSDLFSLPHLLLQHLWFGLETTEKMDSKDLCVYTLLLP